MMRARHWVFGLFIFLSLGVFWSSLKELVHAGLKLEFCSQILIAPFISMLLVYSRRNSIFRTVQPAYVTGGMSLTVGIVIYWLARHYAGAFGSYNVLSVYAFAIFVVWISGFYALYGPVSIRAAAFPFGFLLLMIPIPSFFLNWSIMYLQWGTTEITRRMLQLLGVPVLQHGFKLTLPGLTIEVARECSSIRSSIALVITCLLGGFLFLRSATKRAALVLLALPLSILKNGVRIVTLSLLSLYVNPAFMRSDLHRDGGILFYLLALVILYPFFRWLETLDRRGRVVQPGG